MSSSMALQLRPMCRPISTPATFIHFFSSSSTPDPNAGANPNDTNTTPQEPPSPPPPPQSKSSFSSYFSDVKSTLKHQVQHQQQRPTSQLPRQPSSLPLATEKPPSKIAYLEEIRSKLSEFRLRSAPPSSTDPNLAPPSQPISFQELYKRNVIGKQQGSRDESAAGSGTGPGGFGDGGKFSFEAIRMSLNQLGPANVNRRGRDPMSLSAFKNNLRLQQADSNTGSWPTRVIGGGSEALPSIFDKEIRAKKEGDSSVPAGLKTEFVKMYSYEELGKKLRLLRPERKKEEGENWFSLTELNERLAKLREIEEKETEANQIGGVTFKDLRDSLAKLKMSDEEKTKKSTIQRLDILTSLGRTPNFMMGPPKEQLVEKYFHPDNMSSAEKLKIELQKVRDEFKMSESDCGSARVQVAQLTTKIKHLATALHKKDKHSRKGLQEMVQKRKKLLKYLRRTDWDSYCFVLSRLGLRDNPNYKTMT